MIVIKVLFHLHSIVPYDILYILIEVFNVRLAECWINHRSVKCSYYMYGTYVVSWNVEVGQHKVFYLFWNLFNFIYLCLFISVQPNTCRHSNPKQNQCIFGVGEYLLLICFSFWPYPCLDFGKFLILFVQKLLFVTFQYVIHWHRVILLLMLSHWSLFLLYNSHCLQLTSINFHKF